MSYKKEAAASRANSRARYADGGAVSFAQRMAPDAPATDEAISDRDIKTWGSARNARAAADARKAARERPASDEEMNRVQSQMSRKRGGRV